MTSRDHFRFVVLPRMLAWLSTATCVVLIGAIVIGVLPLK